MIDLSLIQYLNQLGLNYSHVVYLQYLSRGLLYQDLPRGKLKNDLVSLGFVFEYEITERGHKVLKEVDEWSDIWEPDLKIKPKVDKKEIYSSEFLEFWDTFPAIDAFTYNNVPFRGTRNLRTAKDRCNAKYNMILQEGKYTHQEILRALRYEIIARKDQSVVRGINQLSFMRGVPSWLQERVFENYIDLSKKPYEPVSGEKNRIQMTKTVN